MDQSREIYSANISKAGKHNKEVEFVEVAPRDGFQSISQYISIKEKIAIVGELLKAGFRRMELGSVVSPRALPQMADIAEIAAAYKGYDDARLSLLVPNAKGAEIALRNGYDNLVFVISVSETHNLKNVRQTPNQSLDQLRSVIATIGAEAISKLRIDLATAFDCPFDGNVSLDAVRRIFLAAREIAPDAEFALCDTTGRADPRSVSSRFEALSHDAPCTAWAFHGHDTFGMGVANAFAAYMSGVQVIDGAAAGLGGCPFAPGASGNTAMEDLVFAFSKGGIDSGVDLFQLLSAADRIAKLPGGMTASHLRNVPRERISQVL
ncbi:hydroxymethylglutaryl-CoA lyase [uncultured Sneathiella sp.]|uniref:hydroxymethylglutaryl-CoA lyase n=1 Tax=uncultured Sneathiella sp. TaxID=879315 RepID=UPI0030ECEB39